jgi:lia operon protein LiaI
MKKFGLVVAGGIAAMVLISNLGPLVGLAVSLLVLYFAVKQFLKTDSTAAKIGWGIAGFIILMATASNIPAILGIAAAYVLYLVYKNWDKKEEAVKHEESDPFVNFEKQWAQLKNN